MECEKCGGTGYIVVERGGLSGARRCSCYDEQRVASLFAAAQIPPRFAESSLDNFRLPPDNEIARRALSDVVLAVKKFGREYPVLTKSGLLLIGNPGVGKTHLAVAALRQVIQRGFEGLFYDYQQLLSDIQAGWSTKASTSQEGLMKRVLEVEVLLLDDIGARRAIDWVEDVITEIITYRYNHNKALIATTNLGEPEVNHVVVTGQSPKGETRVGRYLAEIIGERSRSRLFEMCHVEVMPPVKDYRIATEVEGRKFR